MSFFSELKRRNVIRVSGVYAIVSWLLLQVAGALESGMLLPDWFDRLVLAVLLIGFPLAAIFAWAFELTPEGIKRTADVDPEESITAQTGSRLDGFLIVALLIFAAAIVVPQFLPENLLPGPIRSQAGGINAGTAGDSSPSEAAVGRSIAVLPFADLSPDGDQEYFSDGISEEILNVLAQIPELRVAARTSSFLFKEDQRSIGEVAKLLNVEHVLEGSVRKAGTRLRITAQLIQADSGYHLWSNSYDRELTNVFVVQDEIATAIAEALSLKLNLKAAAVAEDQSPEVDPRAYDWYLQGRELMLAANQRDRREAIAFLEKAILIEPQFLVARAHLVIGLARLTTEYGGDLSKQEYLDRANEEIAAIEEVDSALPDLWLAKSVAAEMTGDWALALTHANRALELRPSFPSAYSAKSRALEKLLRPRERLESIEQWLVLDPLSTSGRFHAARALAAGDPKRSDTLARGLIVDAPVNGHYARMLNALSADQDADSLRHSLLAFASDPKSYYANQAAWIVLALNGFHEEAGRFITSGDVLVEGVSLTLGRRYADAEETLRRALDASPNDRLTLTNLAMSVYEQGRYEEASGLYEGLILQVPDGVVYAGGGATDQTLGVLAIHAFLEAGQLDTAEQLAAAYERYFQELEAIGPIPLSAVPMRALLEAINGRSEAALNLLVDAVERGSGQYFAFDSPIFDPVREEPRFQAGRSQALQNYERGRSEMRTLMCENNPVPGVWQPLKSTCTDR